MTHRPNIAATDWPDRVDPNLVRAATHAHMIRYFDACEPDELKAYQRRRLALVLTHAVRSSAWWREWLDCPEGAQSLSFRNIPLMSREAFRASLAHANGPLPLPAEHGGSSKSMTSGSTGIPLAFYISNRSAQLNGAHYQYDRLRQGMRADQPIARIATFMDAHEGSHVLRPAAPLLGQAIEYGRKAGQFTIEQHARWLADVDPTHLIAYTSIIDGMMDVFEAEPDRKPQRLAGVLSFAESVTPEFRERARRVLGARVIDRYSCFEAGPLAFQCPVSDGHLHIAGTSALVEVLDDEGRPGEPGEIGRVFITNLHNLASPVVRYELGDLAAWAPRCVCGHDKPVLTRLLGRTRFLVRLPSGDRKNVNIRARHWMTAGPITEARIVQITREQIRAEYVADRPLTEAECAKLREMLEVEISPEIAYELVQTDRIDWGPTYKRQDVVSLV